MKKIKVFPFFPFFPLKVCYVVFGERVNRGLSDKMIEEKWDMVQMCWPCVTFLCEVGDARAKGKR